MDTRHDAIFDGLFGEEESRHHEHGARPVREPLMAGLFGSRSTPFKAGDRKSPADASTAIDPKHESALVGR